MPAPIEAREIRQKLDTRGLIAYAKKQGKKIIDLSEDEKMMHMVVSAADHISVNKWQGSEYVEFSLIFGFPDDAE